MTVYPMTFFTPTQRKILTVLSDGMPHPKAELIACLWDGDDNALRVMICGIRKHLRPAGQDIICESVRRRTFYRHVRLLSNPYSGTK